MLPSQAEWERKQVCLERVMRIKNEKKNCSNKDFWKEEKGLKMTLQIWEEYSAN